MDELKAQEKQAKQEKRDSDQDRLSARRKFKDLVLNLFEGYQDKRVTENEMALTL